MCYVLGKQDVNYLKVTDKGGRKCKARAVPGLGNSPGRKEIFTVFDWLWSTVQKVHAEAGYSGIWWSAAPFQTATWKPTPSSSRHSGNTSSLFVSRPTATDWLIALVLFLSGLL